MYPAYDQQPFTGAGAATTTGPLFAAASAGAFPALRALGSSAATIFDQAAEMSQPRPIAHRGARLGLTFGGLTLGVATAFVAKQALEASRDAVKQHPDVAVLAGLSVVGVLACGGIWWLGTRP